MRVARKAYALIGTGSGAGQAEKKGHSATGGMAFVLSAR